VWTIISGKPALAATALADTGFLVALLIQRDAHHEWAVAQAEEHPTPWHVCEAVLTEAFHLVGTQAGVRMAGLISRGAVVVSFGLTDHVESVIALMRKYSNRPMSLADACVVRMTEILPDPVVLTTDADFTVYRRHGRQVVPCVTPF
jgi:predicted nucleic acid-binding protein